MTERALLIGGFRDALLMLIRLAEPLERFTVNENLVRQRWLIEGIFTHGTVATAADVLRLMAPSGLLIRNRFNFHLCKTQITHATITHRESLAARARTAVKSHGAERKRGHKRVA